MEGEKLFPNPVPHSRHRLMMGDPTPPPPPTSQIQSFMELYDLQKKCSNYNCSIFAHPNILKLGRITNFDMTILLMGFNF